MRSVLPDGLLVCHGVVRLVLSNGYIFFFHGREVGFTRRFIRVYGTVHCWTLSKL